MTEEEHTEEQCEIVRRFIRRERKHGASRDYVRGIMFGRYEQHVDTDRLIEIMRDVWPKTKLRITAQDFVFLRDMKITLN